MKIGDVARRAGVGVETVRFYERERLIEQPRKPIDGGFRCYSEDTVATIIFIRQAQQLGFSLKEAGDLLALRIDPRADCGDIRARAVEKRTEVNGKIEQLGRIRDALDRVIAACPGSGSVRSCSIIEELSKGDQA